MTALQKRIKGLLSSDSMTVQDVIDAYTPMGIKESDIKKAVFGMVCNGLVKSSTPNMVGRATEVIVSLA